MTAPRFRRTQGNLGRRLQIEGREVEPEEDPDAEIPEDVRPLRWSR